MKPWGWVLEAFILGWKGAFGSCNFCKLGFGMALFGWFPSSFSLLQSHKHSSKTLVAVSTTTNRKIHPVSISSASPGLRYPCLRCCATDDESSSTRIFIKGVLASSPEFIANLPLILLNPFYMKKWTCCFWQLLQDCHNPPVREVWRRHFHSLGKSAKVFVPFCLFLSLFLEVTPVDYLTEINVFNFAIKYISQREPIP